MRREQPRIFHGGNIITLDSQRSSVEAIAIGDGRVVGLGTLPEMESHADPSSQKIDLRGKALIPSLKDHHLHLTAIGTALLNRHQGGRMFLDLAGIESADAVVERVAERATKVPGGTWILGMGWNQHDWGTHELPTHEALGATVPDHPALLVRTDAHSAWVNAAALKAAGIDGQSDDLPGGAISRLADGEPSGMLLERAVEPLLQTMPETARWEIREAFRLAAEKLAAQGVTEVFDAGFMASPAMVSLQVNFELYLELLRWVDAEHPLPVRVNLMVPAPSPLADKVTANPGEYAELSPRARVTHIKLYADGAFGSRGAALSHPYADDPATQGVLRMRAEELEAETRRAIDAGLDIATHAIGDHAVKLTLDTYEKVLDDKPEVSPQRFRIEHFAYASEEDIRRGADSGFIIVAQPNFIYPDEKGVAMEDWRLGADNCRRVYPWKTLADLGAVLAGSSDCYMIPGPPLWDFFAAHTRKSPAGHPADGWQPQERLSRAESLRLATTLHPPGGDSTTSGLLREGEPANLAILSDDPLAVEESKILGVRVHATLRDGQVTHDDGTLERLASQAGS